MRKNTFFYVIAVLLCSFNTAADPLPEAYDALLNEKYVNNGLGFTVENAKIIAGASNASPQDNAPFAQNVSGEAVPTLAIRYSFTNNNSTKKIDLDEPFEFTLNDEYGNKYHILSRPNTYLEPTAIYTGNFPSVYPGQRIEETVFFEAPIPESRSLFLSIDALNVDIPETIVIKIPTAHMEGREAILLPDGNVAQLAEKKAETQIGPLKIISPVNGASVIPGQTVHLEVGIPNATASPEAIFVVIPSYVLRDDKVIYHYDVTIPEDQNGPLSVVVIGKWHQKESEEILSDSILLNVNTASAL